MTESKLQSDIINSLKKLGFFTTKIIICSRPGFPDLLAIRKGKTIYIEVKKPRKEAEPRQKRIHQMIKHFGATVFVHDSIDKFNKEIAEWMEKN